MDERATFPRKRLELIFACCHPALALDGQVGLTLRTLDRARLPRPVRDDEQS
jgi:RNA polymerase sigma-70 factor, ECF subfamily